jgi:hypothetical protein
LLCDLDRCRLENINIALPFDRAGDQDIRSDQRADRRMRGIGAERVSDMQLGEIGIEGLVLCNREALLRVSP